MKIVAYGLGAGVLAATLVVELIPSLNTSDVNTVLNSVIGLVALLVPSFGSVLREIRGIDRRKNG